MLKSQQRIEALRKKMEQLGATKIPTQDYKDVSKQIADAEKKQAALNERMEKFAELGGNTNTKAFRSMQYDAVELENTIAYAKGELQDLVDTGKAFTLGSDTAEYSGLAQQLADAQAELNNLVSVYAEMQAKMESAGRTEAIVSGFERVKNAAIQGFSAILKYAGKAGTAIKGVASKVAGMAVNALAGFKSIGTGAGSSAGKVGQLGNRILSLAKTVFIWRVLRTALNNVRSAISESFSTYLNYDASLKASIASLKSSLATLQGSFASAFAPIVSVVVPYISTLVNWLITAVNAVAAFIAALTGQSSYKRAIASVSGVGDAASDAAGSLGDATDAAKELNKELGQYDELSVIGDTDSSSGSGGSGGSGGGGGAAGGGLTYEDVEIESSISDMADKIKEAWENADFTEIGNILGEKLRDGLLSIPWDGIQEAAEKVGKSVATLINGFVETAGLGDAIGMTVAEAINTGILGVESFATNLHWDSVGQFVADGINGALTRIDWQSAINAASAIGSGIATALNKVITPETFGNIGKTLANALNTVVSGAYSFVSEVNWTDWGAAIASGINNFFHDTDWKTLGLTFSGAAKGLLNTLKTAVSDIDWSGVGSSIGDALMAVDWNGLLKDAAGTVGSIFAGLLDFGSALSTRLFGSEWDNYILDVNAAIKGLSGANDEIERMIEQASDWKTAAEEEYGYAENLAEQYFDLAEQANLTNQEKEKMKTLASELVKTIPELEQYYNSETGLLDTTREHVEDLIESLKAKARTEAAQDALKEFYTAQYEAKKVIEECTSAAQDYNDVHSNLIKTISGVKEQEAQLLKQYENGEISLEKYTQKHGELEERLGELYDQLGENEQAIADNATEMHRAEAAYDSAGSEIDEITEYFTDYSSSAENANEKTKNLIKSLDDLSKESQITITMKGFDATWDEKISVIAEVTGTDYSNLPVSEKYIDDMYAEIVKTYTSKSLEPLAGVSAEVDKVNVKNNVSLEASVNAIELTNTQKKILSAVVDASDLSNSQKRTLKAAIDADQLTNTQKKTLTALVNASSISNNGKIVTTTVKASGIDNNGKTVTAAVKAKSLSASGKKLKASVSVSSITNVPTMRTRVNVIGQTNTPTISARVRAMDSIWARNSAVGGVYSGSAWRNLPQFATGGIINLAGKIAQFASGGTPDHGTVFVAGEAGAEIVGNIGGRTEILNKSQLASVMYSAVLNAMLTAVSGLAQAINTCTIECTNTAIQNLGYILENLRAINTSLGVPQVAIAGIPHNIAVPDANRISQTYTYQSSGNAGIDINALADAVVKRVSVNIGIENVMTLDSQPVYRKMVEIDSQAFRQTGRGGFEH